METLNINDANHIRTIELDRPNALNAFSSLLMDELAQAFIDARNDDEIKVIVLTGAGRAFSAGADLSEMGTKQAPPKYGFPGLLEAILACPKPFIAAVNGMGVGVGTTICGLADLVYMSESARLRCPFSSLGIVAEAASTYLFPQLMGRQKATWFLLAGEWMSAQECVDAGLALEVLAPEQLMPRALAQASKLAKLPSSSVGATRNLILAPHMEQIKASIKAENEALAKLTGGPANIEAVTAFMEKREPDFSKV